MYSVDCSIVGIAPLMQHRFPMPEFETLSNGGSKSTGAKDYSQEWREYFYAETNGQIFQPADHIVGSLVKASVGFKVTGKRGKTYKDLFQANIFVTPDRIPHNGFFVPESLDLDADKLLYLDMRPVIVNRSRVVRLRPTFKPGWSLDFEIQVIDDEIQPALLQDVVILAGKSVGIGDYRPRFGRFNLANFAVHK